MPNPAIVLWNSDKTASVVASKIREFTIAPVPPAWGAPGACILKGWYNSSEAFEFGWFNSVELARAFLKDIHKKMADEG